MAPFRHRHLFCAWSSDSGFDDGLNNAETSFDSHTLFDRNGVHYDQRYAQEPTTEPLSDDMVRKVRDQLATLFYERMATGILSPLKYKLAWSTYGTSLYCIRRFKQNALSFKCFLPRRRLARAHLLEYADVHIALYIDWFDHDLFAEGCVLTRSLGRYIWRKWFYWHAGRPPFLAYQKFAKPIGLRGGEPRTIQNVRSFHRSLCDAVAVGLQQEVLSTPSPSTRRSRRNCYQPRNPGPSQPTNPATYRDKGWQMAHLFRAIVIIVDKQVKEYEEPEMCRPGHVSHASSRHRGMYRDKLQDWRMSQCSVLLLKTGDDAHLSSPISFQPLYDAGKALPVDRPDCNDDGTSVIRVKIDTALEFVFDLIRREQEMVPAAGLAAEIENRQHLEVCEKWIDGVMDHAGRVGIDTNGFTWEAVRRVKASMNGEAFSKYQIDPPWNHTGIPYICFPFTSCYYDSSDEVLERNDVAILP